MTCLTPDTLEKINPWVTQGEIDKALNELEKEGLAEYGEFPMTPSISDVTDIYWRKI
jgi:hypothetical protein